LAAIRENPRMSEKRTVEFVYNCGGTGLPAFKSSAIVLKGKILIK